jgi:hypothetical protein
MPKKGFVDNATGLLHRNLRDRVEAFENYGGLKCSCCGVTELAFLSLNHIAGGGNEDRRERFGVWYRGGHELYRMLRSQKWPKGYRVLCMNCQQGIRDNGGQCPHKDPPLTPHERLEKFDLLRVGWGNFELTQTPEYQAALSAVKRKGDAKTEDVERRKSRRKARTGNQS